MRLCPLLAIAVGAPLLVAPVAHAARGMEVAISDEDAMVSGKAGNALLAYQTAHALNATRMRILVQWSGVTGGDGGAYQWGAIDNAIDAAALYGMRIQLDLTGPAPANAAGLYKGRGAPPQSGNPPATPPPPTPPPASCKVMIGSICVVP
jgi:hypothetical protein